MPEANQIRVDDHPVSAHAIHMESPEPEVATPPEITLGTIWAVVQDTAGRVRKIEAALKRRGLA